MKRHLTINRTHLHRHGLGVGTKYGVRPKRELMICLGWLRLFQAITSK